MINKIKSFLYVVFAAVCSVLLTLSAYYKSKSNAAIKDKALADQQKKQAQQEVKQQEAVVKAQSEKLDKTLKAQNKSVAEAKRAQDSITSGKRDYFEEDSL